MLPFSRSGHVVRYSDRAQARLAHRNRQSYPKSVLLSFPLFITGLQPVSALPPPEDIPEEVMRTEIFTEARSPIDGKPLTAAEYAELQAKLRTGPQIEPELSPQVRRTVNLLKLRKFIKTFFPFIPIKQVPQKSSK
jgi:hypothetical protein